MRVDEMRTERTERIQEQDREVKGSTVLRQERQQEAAELYGELHAQLGILRDKAQEERLKELYQRLDQYQTAMGDIVSMG